MIYLQELFGLSASYIVFVARTDDCSVVTGGSRVNTYFDKSSLQFCS